MTPEELRNRINEVLNLDVVLIAAQEQMFGMGNAGFCVNCGEEADGCEPDARGYHCDFCGADAVYGASEIMLHVC